MQEIWKDIPNYEGLYQASNKGQIRTHKDKVTYTKRHGKRHWKQRVLKPKSKNSIIGYRVTLWKDGKGKDYLVARLVGTTFLENLIDTNMTINHKDGNRLNNHVDNLEWLSRADNIRHGFENDLYKQTHIKITNKQTNEEHEFRSMSVASKFIGRNHGYISNNLKKGKHENKEFKWEVIK